LIEQLIEQLAEDGGRQSACRDRGKASGYRQLVQLGVYARSLASLATEGLSDNMTRCGCGEALGTCAARGSSPLRSVSHRPCRGGRARARVAGPEPVG
jgi:hypothetical protein